MKVQAFGLIATFVVLFLGTTWSLTQETHCGALPSTTLAVDSTLDATDRWTSRTKSRTRYGPDE